MATKRSAFRVGCATALLCGGCVATTGPERCDDGVDDDGDGAADCADDDCAATCGGSCESAIPLSFGVVREGTTRGRENLLDAYCTATPSGGDVYYRVVAPFEGRFRARVSASEPIALLVLDRCPDAEVACAGPAPIDVSGALRAGEGRYLVVSAQSPGEGADFSISFERSLCGNGVRDDEDEACDGADFGGRTCADYEFSAGSLACTADCRVDIRSCTGGG